MAYENRNHGVTSSFDQMTLEPRWDRSFAGSVASVRYCSCGLACVAGSSESGDPTARLLAADTGAERGRVALDGELRGASYREPPGLLFLTTRNDRVHAIAPETGETRWTATGSRVEAATDDAVYASDGATLRAIRVGDGTSEWSSVLSGPIQRVSALDDTGDRLGVTVGDPPHHTLVGVDAATGTESFRHDATDVTHYHLDGETLLAIVGDDPFTESVRRIDPRTGAERWTYTVDDSVRVRESNIEVSDDAIYVSEGDDTGATALNPVTGRPTGTLDDSENAIPCGPVLFSVPDSDGTGEIDALDPQTGEHAWRLTTDDYLTAAAFDGESGDFFLADHAGSVYRTDGDTGTVRWRCPIGGHMDSLYADADPLVAANSLHPMMRGMFTDDGTIEDTVYAIDRREGRAEWSFSADGLVVRGVTARFVVASGDESHYVLRRDDGRVARGIDCDGYELDGETLFAVTGATVTAYPLTDSPPEPPGKPEDGGALPADDADRGDARRLPAEDREGGSTGRASLSAPDDPADPEQRDETAVSFCPDCGADLDPDADANFCMACGAELPE